MRARPPSSLRRTNHDPISPMAILIVKPDRVKKLRNQYPWLYADEIADILGEGQAGEIVEVREPRGDFIGRAFFSPTSHIAARMLTYDASEQVNRAFFEKRFALALARRGNAIQ